MSLRVTKNYHVPNIDDYPHLDDAQYFHLSFSDSLRGEPLFEAKIGRHVIQGFLEGEVDITNYKGEAIDNSETYRNYLKEGEPGKDKLDFGKMAYIQLVDKKTEKKLNMFFSIGDCLKYIKDEFNLPG